MLYNSHATSIPGEPYTYPYVAYFDSSAAEQFPQTTQEAVGLAYSEDGIFWTRYGTEPVLLPAGNTTDWDGKYAYRASVIRLNDAFHMFYSGSSGVNNPDSAFGYAYGIGHASSSDGVNWTRDSDNPIFTIEDAGEAWREGRTLAPSVVIGPKYPGFCPRCELLMWFSGGTNDGGSFNSASIGHAKLDHKILMCHD